MKIIRYLFLMPYYLKGVIRFRSKNYASACEYFVKAIKINCNIDNELLYQYYGQTLLCLNMVDESFIYLSKAYNIYKNKGWDVSDDEEKKLFENTIGALKYIYENHNLKIDGFIIPELTGRGRL